MATARRCAACPAEMMEVDDGQVALDVCTDCGSLFLDAGELQRRGGILPATLVAISAETPRACPGCQTTMTRFGGAQGLVQIDLCEACHGLFLDAGELELLLDAANQQAPQGDEEITEIRFLCDRCKLRKPLRERVIGEVETVCRGCADLHEIASAPKARREAALGDKERKGGIDASQLPNPQFDFSGRDLHSSSRPGHDGVPSLLLGVVGSLLCGGGDD